MLFMYPSRVIILFIILLLNLKVQAQQAEKKDTVKVLLLKSVTIKGLISPSLSPNRNITIKELELLQSSTLGETLSHVPGIQNSYFGPNSGTPVIRSLSGNRVKVLSNGISVNDLSGISPNFNLVADMDNMLGIEIHKTDAGVLYGGKAIGGAVNLRDNTIPTERLSKKLAGFATAEGASNAGFKQAFDLNGDLGKRWAWHAGAMNRFNKDIRIPGNTKAPIAFDPRIDHLTQTMAQVNVDTETTRNLTLYPYISQFVLDNINNPEWGLSEADLYTFQETSAIGGVIVPNPRNTVYVPGQPQGTPLSTTVVKGIYDYAPVTKGIMPNSHSNSYAINLGTSYIGERFRAGIGYRKSFGYYGIPGFALLTLPGHTHNDGHNHSAQGEMTYLPINTRSASNSLLLESEYRPENYGIGKIRLNYMAQGSQDSELIGDYLANKFASKRQVARIEIEQQALSFLKGLTGLDYAFLKLNGSGKQRYLPDNLSREYGIFTLQQIKIKPIDVDLGYRHDLVQRRAMRTPGYTPSRGLAGGKLSPKDFQLNHFNAGLQLNITKSAFLKGSYQHSERAPDINELYSGNNHFSIMLEENGDDRLTKEVARTMELAAGLNLKGLRLLISHYQTRFNNYMYLAHTGISRSGGFLVKEWRQADTRITGWEAELDYQHIVKSDTRIQVGGYFDLVQNINNSNDHMRDWAEGDYMPNMPTSRFGLSAGYTCKKVEMNILFDRYLAQRFLGKNINPEPPMPSYSLLTARVSVNSEIKGFKVVYFAQVNNLLNTEARPQNSFLKYLAPLPGINISIGIKVNIG
jgi:iron complex outermembrane receptor protein